MAMAAWAISCAKTSTRRARRAKKRGPTSTVFLSRLKRATVDRKRRLRVISTERGNAGNCQTSAQDCTAAASRFAECVPTVCMKSGENPIGVNLELVDADFVSDSHHGVAPAH
jgi:hypothetical protein